MSVYDNRVHPFAPNSVEALALINRGRAEAGMPLSERPLPPEPDDNHRFRLALVTAAWELGERPSKVEQRGGKISDVAAKARVVREAYARARETGRTIRDRDRPRGLPTMTPMARAIPKASRHSKAQAVNKAAVAIGEWISGNSDHEVKRAPEWQPSVADRRDWDMIVRRLEDAAATMPEETRQNNADKVRALREEDEALAILRLDSDGRGKANQRIAIKLTELRGKLCNDGIAENTKHKLYCRLVEALEAQGVVVPPPAVWSPEAIAASKRR